MCIKRCVEKLKNWFKKITNRNLGTFYDLTPETNIEKGQVYFKALKWAIKYKLYNKNAQKLSNKNAQFIGTRIIQVLHSGGNACVNKH